ncbi:hypothetical protein C0Q44_18295 [Paenibacillus sp. PCH8]|uniref:hypothetical protein n=1 Tax=Paenibacillus sp. PCH8 TaxID=2066524 RepID=UPI000CFA37B9|nr:hypothetical protein [Paenibacillus sp. PCH8]PQP81652.1 hypothetical protein C0Q44_18295 [Paenibacillus sp. PCH8]
MREQLGKIIFDPEELKEEFSTMFSWCVDNDIDLEIGSVSSIDTHSSKDSEEFILAEFLNREDFDDDFIFTDDTMVSIVEGQEHIPIEVAILAAFICNRYKFLSQAKDKNLYRLPI